MAEAFLSRSMLATMQRESWSQKERRWIHEVERDGAGNVTPLLPRRLSSWDLRFKRCDNGGQSPSDRRL
jgi:hypothetical protein